MFRLVTKRLNSVGCCGSFLTVPSVLLYSIHLHDYDDVIGFPRPFLHVLSFLCSFGLGLGFIIVCLGVSQSVLSQRFLQCSLPNPHRTWSHISFLKVSCRCGPTHLFLGKVGRCFLWPPDVIQASLSGFLRFNLHLYQPFKSSAFCHRDCAPATPNKSLHRLSISTPLLSWPGQTFSFWFLRPVLVSIPNPRCTPCHALSFWDSRSVDPLSHSFEIDLLPWVLCPL